MCFVCDTIHIAVAKVVWTEYGGDPDQPIAFVVTRSLPRNALVEWQVWTHRVKGSTEKLTAMMSPSKQAGHVYVTKCEEATAILCQLSEHIMIFFCLHCVLFNCIIHFKVTFPPTRKNGVHSTRDLPNSWAKIMR